MKNIEMGEVYRTVNEYGEDEFIENKSIFIGYCKPISDEEEALDFIRQISDKHKDATHNTYAYVYGRDSIIQRFSDDGEPSGTAGIPILEVLKKEDLRNVVVVVTRYFGGVKLGAGGLIRAYTRAAKIGIDSSVIINRTLHKVLKLRIDYTQYGMVENYILKNKYIVDDIKYDDAVNIYVAVKYDKVSFLKEELVNMTSDEIHIDLISERYINL